MIIAPTPSLSFSAVDQIIWSPNSQYIGFNLINWTPYAFVPTVYSIVDTTLSPIINADPNAKQLAWSEDSNYISAAVSVLGSDTIEIYERATASLIETYT